ncbi:MAG: NifU family protein [bacterium]|nr:NifU family protein [bacterium]
MNNNKNNKTDKAIIDRIKKEIEIMRPFIQEDGGDVEFVSFDESNGIVAVDLQGHCVGCALSQVTLKQGLEVNLKTAVPEVKEVVIAE